MKPFTLIPLLQTLGVELNPERTKLVRHQDRECEVIELTAAGQLELYQSNQESEIFKDCDQILIFTADGGSRSLFTGLYQVKGVDFDPSRRWPADYLYPNASVGAYWYHLVKDSNLQEFELRLVIDWGQAMRAWHQWLRPHQDKLVIEIKASGRGAPFPGYDDVVLDFDDLCNILRQREANPDWYHGLSKVSGVYLIQDTSPNSGHLYVGSAYGADGIWGRWSTYGDCGHGGNVRLRELCERDPGRQRNFRFSILQTMPLSADKDQVLAAEVIWKKKLGTRAFGLNHN